MKKTLVIFIFLLNFISLSGYGQIYQAVSDGDWNDPNTWMNLFTGLPGVPGGSDIARIQGPLNITVTGTESCANLIMSDDGSNSVTELSIGNGGSLTMNSVSALSVGLAGAIVDIDVASGGSITFNAELDAFASTGGSNIILTIAGDMNVAGSLDLVAEKGDIEVELSGQLTTDGQVTLSQTTGVLEVNMDYPGATWNFNGDWVAGTNWGTLSNGTNSSSIIYGGSAAQTLIAPSSFTYHDIEITNTTGVSLDADLDNSNFLGDLNIPGYLLLNGNSITGPGTSLLSIDGQLEMNGASLFPQGFGTLSIGSSSTVTYSRSDGGAQDVDNVDYNILEISGNGTKNLIASAYSTAGGVSNLLDIQNGVFDLGGLDFTLYSTASRTANLGSLIGTSSISGTTNFHVQRYMDGMSTPGWRHLGSPISGSTVNDWMQCTGPGSSGIYFYGFTGSCNPSSSYINISIFVESLAATSSATSSAGRFNDGYFYNPGIFSPSTVTSASGGIAPAGGYSIYTGGASYSTHQLELTGTPNTGNISVSIDFTSASHSDNGWNFVANPYPSAINWSTVAAASSNIGSTAYVFDASSGWQSISSSGGQVASSQAIFVKATSGGASVNFTEAAKTTDDVAFVRSSTANMALTTVQLFDSQFKYSNKAFLKQDPFASNDYVQGEDILKMIKTDSTRPYIYWNVSNQKIETNSIMELSNNSSDLVFDVPSTGVYYLTLSGNNTGSYSLTDNLTHITYAINHGDTLGLQLAANDQSARFTLTKRTPLQAYHFAPESCFGSADGQASFDLYAQSTVGLYDRDGQLLHSASGNNRVTIGNLTHGKYHYRVESSTAGNVVGSFVIPEQPRVESKFYLSSYVIDLSNDSLVTTNNHSDGDHFEWYLNGEFVSSDQNTSFEIDEAGEHELELLSFSANETCISSSTAKVTALDNLTFITEKELTKHDVILATHDSYFTATAKLASTEKLTFRLYDISGRLVWTKEGESNGPVRIPRMGDGIYLLSIEGESINQTIKLVP